MERFQGNINSKQFTILLLVFIHSFADARYYSFRTVLDLRTRTANCFIAGICVKYEFNVWQGISKYRRFCRFLFQYLECRLAFISPLEGCRLHKVYEVVWQSEQSPVQSVCSKNKVQRNFLILLQLWELASWLWH